MLFRHHAENLTAANGNSAIIKLAVMAQRHSDKHERAEALACLTDTRQRLLCGADERAGGKKIPAGIPRHRKLGKYKQRNIQLLCLCHIFYDFIRVIRRVRDFDFGSGRCGNQKTVLHRFKCPFGKS